VTFYGKRRAHIINVSYHFLSGGRGVMTNTRLSPSWGRGETPRRFKSSGCALKYQYNERDQICKRLLSKKWRAKEAQMRESEEESMTDPATIGKRTKEGCNRLTIQKKLHRPRFLAASLSLNFLSYSSLLSPRSSLIRISFADVSIVNHFVN